MPRTPADVKAVIDAAMHPATDAVLALSRSKWEGVTEEGDLTPPGEAMSMIVQASAMRLAETGEHGMIINGLARGVAALMLQQPEAEAAIEAFGTLVVMHLVEIDNMPDPGEDQIGATEGEA